MSDAQVPDVVRDQVYEAPEGLEDFDQKDLTIPMLRLDHKKGKIVDSLSNQEFDTIEVIAVGLVKQRVLWPAEVEEDAGAPLCKSYTFKVGHPDVEKFPWAAAEFTPDADATELPCENCKLKDWGTHPTRDVPWCSEQHTYVVLQDLGEGNISPALMTFQRSAIKPSNTYLSSFVRAKQPLYVCTTKISFESHRRGNVDFIVPIFSRGDDTDQQMWPYFANTYREIREFVQTPRSTGDDDAEGDNPDEAVGTPPVATPPTNEATAAPAAEAPAPAPEPVAAPAAAASAPAGDDLPF